MNNAVGREEWRNRTAFILSSIGFAIGIGNLWRFPYVCYANGGGAFLIPYFVALIVCGIPICILEFGIGHFTRGSPPSAFAAINKKFEWIGWWAVLVTFGIVIYYTVVIGWSIIYMGHSISLGWGTNTEIFFYDSFLRLTEGPYQLGGINGVIVLANVVVWIFIFLILRKGLSIVGKVVWFTVLGPWIILVILTIRGLTLPGAIMGISYYLTPDFNALGNPKVWLAAFAQVFFSIGISWGALIAYASHLPEKSDVANNAFIVVLANCGTSFFAGFAVFSALGYLSYVTGTPVQDVVASGPGLAYVTFPTIINMMPVGAPVFGVLFFLCLFTLGIDSAFGMVEVFTDSLHDKFGISKGKSLVILCIIGFIIGLIFCSGSGFYWLDIVDKFLSDVGLVPIGIAECMVVGYIFGANKLKKHINKTSELYIGNWWVIFIKIITPLTIAIVLVVSWAAWIKTPYGGYPKWALMIAGWGLAILVLLLSIMFMMLHLKGDRTITD